jgi:hypothetical protein
MSSLFHGFLNNFTHAQIVLRFFFASIIDNTASVRIKYVMLRRVAGIAKAARVSLPAAPWALNNKAGVSVGLRRNIVGLARQPGCLSNNSISIAVQMGYPSSPPGRELNEIKVIKLLKTAGRGHTINERIAGIGADEPETIPVAGKLILPGGIGSV